MTLHKRPKAKIDKKIGKREINGEGFSNQLNDRIALKKRIAKIADRGGSYSEVIEELRRTTGRGLTPPSVGKYLREVWGPDFKTKQKEMRERKSLQRKWRKDFENTRLDINQIFHKDYVTNSDGLFYEPDENKLISMPPVGDTETSWRNRDKITFSKEGWFGYKENPVDRNILGSADLSIKFIMKKQLAKRLNMLANEEIKAVIDEKINTEIDKLDLGKISLIEAQKQRRNIRKKIEASSVVETQKIKIKYANRLKELFNYIDTTPADHRSRVLLDPELFSKSLDPAWASSSKKFRGKQRMLSLKGINPETGEPYRFGRVTMNIPFPLHTHPRRLQIHGHQISKVSAELINSEEPKVPAKFNDIKGVNLKTRFPRNFEEDLMTQEGAIIISKNAAKKMRYFFPVEEGNLMVDDLKKLPDTIRVPKEIKTYKNYRKLVDKDAALEIQRNDPLVIDGISGLGEPLGDVYSSHSGKLIFIGEPKLLRRKLTVDPNKNIEGKSEIEIEYYRQPYQIVREDDLKIGDKCLSRSGIKSVIADIRDIGDQDVIVNYRDVWQEADPNDPEYDIKEETLIKHGKKKSSVVLEHKNAEGNIFYHLIDKFAQDEVSTGLRYSTTMVGGLWEWELSKILGKESYTNTELDQAMQRFTERYFGEPGTFVSNLKALHYRFVKNGDEINIEIDPNEPEADEYGDIYPLYHRHAGHEYEYAYLPHSIQRLYADVRTLREYFQIDPENKDPETSNYHWSLIKKQIVNGMYLFPKNPDSIGLTVVPYVNKNDITDVQTIVMDASDIITAGGNPNDPDLRLSWRKEPVTSKESVQTARVIPDFTGKMANAIAIHPVSARKGTVDYDGDQVVVFSPPISAAELKLSAKEKKELLELKNKDYNKETFEQLYDKAKYTTYADNEHELAIKCAKYNQETQQLENFFIQQLGGLRKRALLLYKAERPRKIVIGSGVNKREFDLTPELVNKICDVEKILKMREPYWVLKDLYKKKWSDLTDSERDLVQDFHIRREINRMINTEVKTYNLQKIKRLIQEERSFIEEDVGTRERGVEPLGLKINTKSNRLLDKIILHMIKVSGIEVVDITKEEDEY